MDIKVYNTIKGYADRRDISSLKYIFTDSLDVDPTFTRYEDGYNYCKLIPGLLENHIELTPFIYDASKWDEAYWTRLKRDLVKNFSDRRMSHMREVAQVFLADKIQKIQAERATMEHSIPAPTPVTSSINQNPRIKSQQHINMLSKAEEQQIWLEQERKRHEEEEAKKEKQRKQEEYRRQQREQELRKQQEEAASKKMKGVVLVASIVVAGIILLLIMVQCNPRSVKQMEFPDSQEQTQISTVQQL